MIPKRGLLQDVADSRWFTLTITFLIVVNCFLISLELDYPHRVVFQIQKVILYVFLIEILIRWFGRSNNASYFRNGWNYFDVFLVSVSFIPETLIDHPELLTSLRILRVFRVFRLVKAFPELQVVTRVLFRSVSSLTSVCFLMMIVMYLYSIMGVILFRGKSQVITGAGAVGDPFGGVLEAMFSMFRVLTGEDWTDLRYDLLLDQSGISQFAITSFFISFYVVAAFLLINLVVGAVCNNYNSVVNGGECESKMKSSDSSFENEVLVKLDDISSRLSDLEKSKDVFSGREGSD